MTWSGWASLGGKFNGEPSVGFNAYGRLEVFAVGVNGDLQHIKQTGTAGWSGAVWDSLGGSGSISSIPPRAIWNQDSRLEVFALGFEM